MVTLEGLSPHEDMISLLNILCWVHSTHALRSVLVLALSTGVLNLQGQPAWKLQASVLNQEAAHLATTGNHLQALEKYKASFTLDPWSSMYCYDAVSSAIACGDPISANALLSLGVQHGFDPKTYTGALDLQEHLTSDASIPFRTNWSNDRMTFASTADPALIEEIIDLAEADQAVRKRNGSAFEEARTDSTNFESLLRIVEKRGFPTPQKVGLTSGLVWLLLWHHPAPEYPASWQWLRVLPYIRSAIEAGDLSPSFLCMFEDYSDHEAGRPMRYGTLLGFFQRTPERLYFIDHLTLDRDRASVGLGPLEWTAAELGFDLGKVRFAEP